MYDVKSLRYEVARAIFDAPYEVWDDATEISKEYYLRLADRAIAGTRKALEARSPTTPQYWAGMRLADHLLAGLG